jgi:hypothetical protein
MRTVGCGSSILYFVEDLEPDQTVQVTPADFDGPVPSIVAKTNDYGLVFSAVFVLLVILRLISVSRPVRVAGRWIMGQLTRN